MTTGYELQQIQMPGMSKAMTVFNGIFARMTCFMTTEKAILGFPLMVVGLTTSPSGVFGSITGTLLPVISIAAIERIGRLGLKITDIKKRHPTHFPANEVFRDDITGLSDFSPLRGWQRVGKSVGIAATVACMAAPNWLLADMTFTQAHAADKPAVSQVMVKYPAARQNAHSPE